MHLFILLCTDEWKQSEILGQNEAINLVHREVLIYFYLFVGPWILRQQLLQLSEKTLEKKWKICWSKIQSAGCV